MYDIFMKHLQNFTVSESPSQHVRTKGCCQPSKSEKAQGKRRNKSDRSRFSLLCLLWELKITARAIPNLSDRTGLCACRLSGKKFLNCSLFPQLWSKTFGTSKVSIVIVTAWAGKHWKQGTYTLFRETILFQCCKPPWTTFYIESSNLSFNHSHSIASYH